MGGVTLIAEGIAARVVRVDLGDATDGVVDMWSVALHDPRFLPIAEGVATLATQLAIVCVRIDALPPDPDPIVQALAAARPATHGIGLGLVTELGGVGTAIQPGHVAYSEFTVDDDQRAAQVVRAVANCVAWGDVPIGAPGSALAWSACVAGAATVVRNSVAEPGWPEAKGDTLGT